MSTMHAAATQIIDSIPTRRQMFIDGLRSLRKHPPPTTPALPDHVLVRPEATLDADEIAAYAEVCGFDRAQGVPLTFPHVLAFPLHMLLLTAPDFPYPAVGMVHLSNSITQRKPLMRGQSLRIEVRCSRWLAHTKGQALAIETQACHGGESVWHSESVYLSRREHSPIGEFYHDSLAPDLQRLVQLERWQLNADLGRRYARVSGDHNPIHVSRVGARLFGFKRTIAHGMWTKARALAGVLPSRALATAHVAVSFKTPAFLPGEVLLQIDPQISGKRFAVRCAQDARPHLYGHLHGVSIA